PEGFIIKLAKNVEVSGLSFVDMKNPALLGVAGDYSGVNVHNNNFSRIAPGQKELIYAIELDAEGKEDVKGVKITDNTFRNGDWLGAVRVQQKGSSTGDYHLMRDHADTLGGRLFHVQTFESANVKSEVLDSDADNIGLGNKNSDSILPYLMGKSRQTILVKNFRYKNTTRQGNGSNTGMEIFL